MSKANPPQKSTKSKNSKMLDTFELDLSLFTPKPNLIRSTLMRQPSISYRNTPVVNGENWDPEVIDLTESPVDNSPEVVDLVTPPNTPVYTRTRSRKTNRKLTY